MTQYAKVLPLSLKKKSNQSSVSTNKLIEDLEITGNLIVAGDDGLGIWNFVNFYIKKSMSCLEELQEKYKSTVLKLNIGATYYTVMNNLKAIEVTYDLTYDL